MQSPNPHLEEILPGVFRWHSRADGFHQPVNSYVWNGLLVDPAVDVPLLNRPGAPAVAHILVTHVQEEHLAGAAIYSDVPLHVPCGDEYLCAGDEKYRASIERWEAPWDWETRGNFRGHLAGARNERPPQLPLRVESTLTEYDSFHGVRVLATPGHGKNALTFLAEIEGKRVAFCGDLIYDNGKLWNWFDCDWDYGLETGQRTLLASARKLLEEKSDVLLPAHGDPVFDAEAALKLLIERLEDVLTPVREWPPVSPVNFPDNDIPNADWRRLSEHLYQHKTGNCAMLVSKSGAGLLVDDGLCHFPSLGERRAHHREVMQRLKNGVGVSNIEAVVITHYHGDHTYNIPMLQDEESGAVQVITLDVVAPLVHSSTENSPEYNVAAPLWWYGCEHDCAPVHKILSNGESFQWHEYEIELFHLGGQTYYHCGVQVTVDGANVLFVGDALYGWDEECEPVLTFNDAEPSTRGWAYAVDRMLERRPDLLICGHGSAVREPMPLLETKHQAWQKRLAAFDLLSARRDRMDFFNPFSHRSPNAAQSNCFC